MKGCCCPNKEEVSYTKIMDQPWNEGRYCRVRLVPQQNGERVLLPDNNTDPNTQSPIYPIPIPVHAQPQTTNRENIQVFRLAPRAVYNLQMDGRGNATRRGSVDSGLHRVIRYGSAGPESGGSTRVIRIGPSTGANCFEGDRAPRVIRMGPGYSDSTSQGFHIANAPGSGPQPTAPTDRFIQDYHTRRANPNTALHIVQDPSSYQAATVDPSTARMQYDLTNQPGATYEGSQASMGSPRVIRITPRFVQSFSTAGPQPAGTLENNQPCFAPQTQNESPRVISFNQREHSNSPKTIHYRVSSQSHPLSSEWQSSSTGSTGNYPGSSNTSSYYEEYPTNSVRMTRATNCPADNSNDAGQSGPVRMGGIGKSNSTEETFLLGPNGQRRVSVQMIGKGGGSRRGSIPIYSSEFQTQPSYYNDGRMPTQTAATAPQVRTIRVAAAPPAGPDSQQQLTDFDRIIRESIQQFMMQRQPYENPNTPWRTSSSVWHKINETGGTGGDGGAGGAGGEHYTNLASNSSNETPDRNLFKNCQFQFRSIGNLSRSNSTERGGGGSSGGSDTDTPGSCSGKWNRGGTRVATNGQPGAPVAIFFFNDFDDMVARMRELKDGSDAEGESLNRLVPNVITSSSCTETVPTTVPIDGTGVSANHEEVNELAAPITSFGLREAADVDSGYDSLDGPNKYALHGKTGTFRPHMMLTKNVRCPNREVLRRKIELFNQNTLGLIVSLDQFTESFDGFIRVTMNLIRPVQMTCGSVHQSNPQAPSAAGTAASGAASAELARAGSAAEQTTTTFYLPKDTSKVIHITSKTTTKEVIRSLLAKFLIKDNPMKFALYENIRNPTAAETMRRLNDDDIPLALCLSWTDEGLEGLKRHEFVLQENDTGEILWEAFSLPELENFLLMLNKESDEYIKQVRTTYRLLKIQLHKRLKQLKRDRLAGTELANVAASVPSAE